MAKRVNQRRLFAELAAKFGPEVAAAFMEAVRDLTSGVEFQKLALAIERRDIEAAIEALHLDPAALLPLENKIYAAYEAGGQAAVKSMPTAASIGFRFDPGNQRAAEWIRRHAANLITGLVDAERRLAREFIAQGMEEGRGPRSVALDLVGRISRVTGNREGGLIGLSGQQRGFVEGAKAELASTDPAMLRRYLTRGRRDRRYDAAVRKAIREGKAIPAETRRMMATRYAARLSQLRGEVIARTEALPAIRAAKREAWQQLVDSGRVGAGSIVRGWHAIGDARTRDTHAGMNGQQVRGLDAPFRSPSGALMMYPGDSSLGAPAAELIACRCDESISIRRPE